MPDPRDSQSGWWAPVDPVPIPAGPHGAVHYGQGIEGYEFFAAVERRDGIPIGRCFCGRRRPFDSSPSCGSAWSRCECGIEWVAKWGRLGWVDRRRHTSRPEGVVA